MKLVFSKSVYDQFDDESRIGLVPRTCDCIEDGGAKDDCDSCDGGGVVYECTLSPEDSSAIEDNLRSQGVPLGKGGTH
jgi:hypothetical protein